MLTSVDILDEYDRLEAARIIDFPGDFMTEEECERYCNDPSLDLDQSALRIVFFTLVYKMKYLLKSIGRFFNRTVYAIKLDMQYRKSLN
jgi:hypothetical protein